MIDTKTMTDKQIEKLLTPFIGNITLRKEERVKELDYRKLVYITQNIIGKDTNLDIMTPEVVAIMVNNTLIFSASNIVLSTVNVDLNDEILRSVISNRKFYLRGK